MVNCSVEQDLGRLDWIAYDSRNAAEVAYAGGSLFVRFARGAVYRYDGFPLSDWEKLQRSGGSGQVFVDLVRSRFIGTRISG